MEFFDREICGIHEQGDGRRWERFLQEATEATERGEDGAEEARRVDAGFAMQDAGWVKKRLFAKDTSIFIPVF